MLDIRINEQPDIRLQDGGLPHAMGVHSFEIVHADRTRPQLSDAFGWTYNHAPMLCFYHGRYYVEYLSSPVSEHEAPGRTLLSSSSDGIVWTEPQVIFPAVEICLEAYKGPRSENMPESVKTVPHQRVGFYCASNDCMLIMSFYGIVHDRSLCSPCDGWGVGRAVRRLYPDGSLGDICFLMYNEIAGFTRGNTDVFPYFKDSGDPELIVACNELLRSRLAVLQFYEEQRNDKSLFPVPLRQAPCTYKASDGRFVTVFKHGYSMVTNEHGNIIEPIAPNESLKTSTGKVWGQRTPDGRYCLVYAPTPDAQHRWPLAVVSSDDGYAFSEMRALTGWMSPQRYGGLDKNLGPQYVRGICYYNPQPDDGRIHIVYSNNKEDIWISHFPPQGELTAGSEIEESLAGGYPVLWNIYSPKLAPVTAAGDYLRLTDRDVYDRAHVERVVKPSPRGTIALDIKAESVSPGYECVIELIDEHGAAAARVGIDGSGELSVRSAGRVKKWIGISPGARLEMEFRFDCLKNGFSVSCLGNTASFTMNTACNIITRVDISTKAPESIPYCGIYSDGKYGSSADDLPLAGQMIPETVLDIYSFSFSEAAG